MSLTIHLTGFTEDIDAGRAVSSGPAVAPASWLVFTDEGCGDGVLKDSSLAALAWAWAWLLIVVDASYNKTELINFVICRHNRLWFLQNTNTNIKPKTESANNPERF